MDVCCFDLYFFGVIEILELFDEIMVVGLMGWDLCFVVF